MNALTEPSLSKAVHVTDIPLLEREIALMERAIALHDRHALLAQQMEERGLTPIAGARMSEVVEAVAARHGLSAADLLGRSNARAITAARQEAMWELRGRRRSNGQPRWSLAQIGEYMGRDHATVIWGIRAHGRRSASKARAA